MNLGSLAGRRILVVEDDYMIAQDVRNELEQAGATVVGPVPSVAQALGLLERGADPNAAVLDVNLGSERSFPIAEALRARGVPFLFSTGYNAADIPPAWAHVAVAMKPLRLAAVADLLRGD